MKKIIGITIIFLLFNFNKIYAQDYQYITLDKFEVHIISLGYSGLHSCTGTVIYNKNSKAIILTCKHCLVTDREYYADNYKIDKIVTKTGDDLAYLIINSELKDKECAILAKKNPEINTIINLYGEPGFKVKHKSRGKILFYSEEWMFAELSAIPGCSGAGVFDEENKLVGVLWGVYNENETTKISIITPIERVLKFLKGEF